MQRKHKNPWDLWTGPISRTLERVYNSKSPATLFITRARQLFRESRPVGPPFDPREYADALGIRVTEEDLGVDGILQCGANRKFRIILNSKSNERRKNFTLAHEIAHTFFYFDLHEFGEKYRGSDNYDKEEERLCNLAAAELLMPFSCFNCDLLNFSDKRDVTPETVFSLMTKYRTSLQAVCMRIVWMKKSAACALWKRRGAALFSEWITPFRFKRLALCRTGHSSVEKALVRPRQIITEPDTYYLDGRRTTRRTSSLLLRSGAVFSILQTRPSLTKQRILGFDPGTSDFAGRPRFFRHACASLSTEEASRQFDLPFDEN